MAINAMPALMNGSFSPYCSVMRVFNIEFFLVELTIESPGRATR